MQEVPRPMSDKQSRRLGRCPRAFDPTIPHLSSLAMGAELYHPPPRVHWGLDAPKPIEWGMMLNDRIGDCTIAAAYHAMQLWSAYGRERVLTEPDHFIDQTYRQFAGYDGTDATDNGAVEQDVLRQWLQHGVNVQEGVSEKKPGPNVSKIRFFGEVDPRNHDDVQRTINDCGAAYIGFEVPQWLMEGEIARVWDIGPHGRDRIVGGHAVILTGYERGSGGDVVYDVVSWGRGDLKMTQRFFDAYVDEVYGCMHPWWVDATGHTPLNKTQEELIALMRTQLRKGRRR